MRNLFFLSTASCLSLVSGVMAEEQKPIYLGDVIVEGVARDTRSLLDTPTGVAVLEREALDRQNASTYEELIGDAPGVLIEGGPRGAAQEPNIRGFADEQIVLRIDGGRFNFNQGHRGRFFLDPDIVERVEIVRGGGSALQGSGALGGVISLETRDAYDLLEPGQSYGARLRSSFETNGSGFGQTATVYGAKNGFDGLGFIAYRDMRDDLQDGGGTDLRASQIDIVNGLGKVGFDISDSSRVEGIVSFYLDDGVTPGALDGLASDRNVVDRDSEIFTGRLSWNYDPADNDLIDLTVLGYANTLEITEDRIADLRGDRSRYDTFGFEAVNRSSFDAGMPVDLVYGVEIVRDEQTGERNGAARLQFPDASVTSYASFVEASFEVLPDLTLIPGVRLDRFELRPDGDFANRSETKVLPRFGVSWRPNDSVQLYGNYARAFRAPSLTELYTDDVHFAVPGFALGPTSTFTGVNEFVPTPNLKPETSDQFEIGVRFADRDVFQPGDALSVSVGGYYADVNNFIDQQVTFMDFTTSRFDPVSGQTLVGGTTTSVNVDAELYGLEAEARYDAGDWYLGLSGAIPRGTDKAGNNLGSLPQDRIALSAGLRPWDGVEFGGRLTLASSRTSGTVTTDAYEVVDIFASYTPVDGPLAGVSLRAGIDNLFDETYSLHPNALNQLGRTFKFSGAIKF